MMTTMDLHDDALSTGTLVVDLLLMRGAEGDAIATPGPLLQGDTAATPPVHLGGRLLRRLAPDTTMTTAFRRRRIGKATPWIPVVLLQGLPGLGPGSLLLLDGPRRLRPPDVAPPSRRRVSDTLTTLTTLFNDVSTPRSRQSDAVATWKATLLDDSTTTLRQQGDRRDAVATALRPLDLRMTTPSRRGGDPQPFPPCPRGIGRPLLRNPLPPRVPRFAVATAAAPG